MAAKAHEALKRELRKVFNRCGKFDGSKETFGTWMKGFEWNLQTVIDTTCLKPEAARLSARTVDTDAKFNQLLTDYTRSAEISAILVSGICNILPQKLQDQIMELANWKREEALENVIVDASKQDEVKEAIPETINKQPHVSSIWKFICGQYEASTSAEKHSLYMQLEGTKMIGLEFETFIATLHRRCTELSNIGETVTKGKQFSLLINGMPASIKDTISSIEAGNKTFEEAVEILRSRIRTEKAQQENVGKGHSKKIDQDTTLLVMRSHKPICAHCGKVGHEEANCWKLHKELKKEQDNDFGGVCDWCGRQNHKIEQCKVKKRYESSKAAHIMQNQVSVDNSDEEVLVL